MSKFVTPFEFPTSPHNSHKHPILKLLHHCPKSDGAFVQILSQFITTGLTRHTFPFSRLLFLFSSPPATSPFLSIPFAVNLILCRSPLPMPSSPFLFNTLTSSLVTMGHFDFAIAIYARLFLVPCAPRPNCHTYPSLFKACTGRWLPIGRVIHAHLVKFIGGGFDQFVNTALLGFYSRCGKVASCRHLFDEISSPDLACWNAMLLACARSFGFGCIGEVGSGLELLFLFQRLQFSSGCRPNEMTMVALVSACGDLGALMQGCWAHAYIERNGLCMNQYVATSLIEMYSKCGRLDLAEHMFDKVVHRDTLCYNAMIRGLAVHGRGKQAIELFDRMGQEAVKVDDVTFVVVMSACTHAGMVNEGKWYFSRMRVEFGIEPKAEHYGCLVDLLSRAGQLEEAEEVLQNMPMKPTATFYRSLLGACRIHNNVEIGKRVIHQLIELEPEHGGNYVLLSNLYAKISRWHDVGQVRKIMKEKGINKTPGFSLVEIDGTVHEFLMGDKTHQLSKEIYCKLEEIDRRLHDFGYKPSTNNVLFDMEEEDKEDTLSYHGERLAIAFALLVSDSNAPIRIMKNLRTCDNCHVTIKFISGIYRREIIMRDRNRFHHFKDWKCSCLDYW